MKKLYTTLFTLCLGALTLTAQQLPNNGFEDPWVDCVPWTSKNNKTAQGTTPSPWIISNTVGTGTLGKTTVGNKVAGHNSASAIEIKAANIMNKNIPGYFSLGTAWSTAKGLSGENADGGTFGGHAFTYRPDAVSFYYKRDENLGEKSTVLIYAWKGSWSQANVPGNIVAFGNCTTTTMIDRERSILGLETSQGGNVTPSSDAELIASTTHYISDAQIDWASIEIPIDYKTTSNPTKFNIVFAAGEYFESAPKTNGKALTIDDVTLLYYSRLASLNINGTAVTGFDSNKYSYNIDSEMPDESAFSFTCLGNSGSGKAALSLDKTTATATITVTNTNEGGTDVDGQTSHTYTIQFKNEQSGGDIEIGDEAYGIYKGIVTVLAIDAGLGDEDINRDGNVHIIDNGKNNGTCTFKLPDFALDDTAEGYIGDIVVENMNIRPATGGGYTVNGSVNPLKLTMNGTEIVAKVTVEGTISASGEATMNISVIWLMDPENDPEGTVSGAPIGVKFNGQKETQTPDKPNYGGEIYKGTITVLAVESGLGDEDVIRAGKVHIVTDESDPTKCTFVLPDFALGDTPESYIGDIVVPNLTATKDGDVTKYNGTINPLKLNMGDAEIVAKVTVNGEVNALGVATMNISVIWIMNPENDPEGEAGVPIKVLFNGQKEGTAGIGGIDTDNSNAPVEWYNLNGVRVNGENLAPGIYIRRQGTEVSKIYVK